MEDRSKYLFSYLDDEKKEEENEKDRQDTKKAKEDTKR